MIKQIIKRIFIVVWFLSGLCFLVAMIDRIHSFSAFMEVSTVSTVFAIIIASAQYICLGTADPTKLLDE